jgi:hypothetical protein
MSGILKSRCFFFTLTREFKKGALTMTLTSLKKLLVLLFIFSTTAALAVESFRVPVPRLRVFAQPSTLSQVLTILTQGQVVQAGSNPGGGFKKVLVTDSTGKKRVGYVALADIPAGARAATNTSRSRSRSGGGGGLHNHSAMGLVAGLAYDTGTRSISDSTGTTYTTSTMSGTAPQFGGFYQFSLSQRFSINGELMYKSSSVSGTFVNSLLVTNPVTITQSFITGSILGQFYPSATGNFWIGPGLQLDFGLSAAANINSTNFSLSSNQFIQVYAATGYDFGITRSIYLTPVIAFGAQVNASPIILEANFLARLGFKF